MGAFTSPRRSTPRERPVLEFIYDHECRTCMEMKPEIDKFARELDGLIVVRQYDVRKKKGPFPSTYVPAVRLQFNGAEAIVEAEADPSVLTADGLAAWITLQTVKLGVRR